MPESYSTGPNRVIVRHKGPAGKGIPVGGVAGQILVKLGPNDYDTAWVNAPDGTDAVVFTGAVPANNEVVIFDGTTGKLVKKSGFTLASFALASELDNKVDKVTGKGLSTNDFTNTLQVKLNNLPAAGFFRGQFTDLAAINAFSFNPVPAAGDYVTVTGPAFARYWWNTVTTAWVIESVPYTPVAADIADVLFDDGEDWTLAGNIMFTPALKAIIEEHTTIFENLGVTTSTGLPKGQTSYFNLTGHTVPITAVSDGTNNFVVIAPATSVAAASFEFTGGDLSLGRLQYTGLATRKFHVHATVGHSGTTDDKIVLAVAKNGVVISASRVVDAIKSTADIQQSLTQTLVELATGDYVEVYAANATSTDDLLVENLNIIAVST